MILKLLNTIEKNTLTEHCKIISMNENLELVNEYAKLKEVLSELSECTYILSSLQSKLFLELLDTDKIDTSSFLKELSIKNDLIPNMRKIKALVSEISKGFEIRRKEIDEIPF